MAGLDDFAKGFFGYMLQERTAADAAKREDEQWEKRQRLLAALDVETEGKKQKLKRQPGNTYKDATGNWVTEDLDGGGNVVGTRPASPAEIATVEGTVAKTGLDKFKLDKAPESFNMDREAHDANLAYNKGMLGVAQGNLAQRRDEFKAQQSGGSQSNPVAVIDSWLSSSEGKAAIDALALVDVDTQNIGLDQTGAALKEKPDRRDEVKQRAKIRREVMAFIRGLPEDQRPKTDSELKALLNEYVAQDLDRVRERVVR